MSEEYIKQLEMTVASLHKCLEHSNKDLDEALKVVAERDRAIEKLQKRVVMLESKRSAQIITGFKAGEIASFPLSFADYGPADRIADQFQTIRKDSHDNAE